MGLFGGFGTPIYSICTPLCARFCVEKSLLLIGQWKIYSIALCYALKQSQTNFKRRLYNLSKSYQQKHLKLFKSKFLLKKGI